MTDTFYEPFRSGEPDWEKLIEHARDMERLARRLPTATDVSRTQDKIGSILGSVENLVREARQYGSHPATLHTMSINLARYAMELSYLAGQLRGPKE